MMEAVSNNSAPTGELSWKQQFSRFFLEEQDALPMRVFECLFTMSFLLWMGHCFQAWEEWLTPDGFHLNGEELRAIGYPSPWPLLERWQVAVFGGVILLGAGLVLWPTTWLASVGWKKIQSPLWTRRWGLGLLFFCALYAQRVDFINASTVNRLFIAVYALLALAPSMSRSTVTGGLMQSVAPLRVLQATLILQYFASGLAKMDGDWLTSADVLWSQVQGLHRTELAAWALRVLPRWGWTLQQYAALFLEVGAPLLFTLRFLRPLALTLGIGMHLMIALFMQDLIFFSAVMWPFYALFLPASFWKCCAQFLIHKDAPSTEMAHTGTLSDCETEPWKRCIWRAKLGHWQTDILTRGFGLILYFNLLGHWSKRPLLTFLQSYPASTIYLGLCGLAMMILGPRLLLFILAFLAGADFFLQALYSEPGKGLQQQAADYPFFVLIPLSLTMLVWALWRDTRSMKQPDRIRRWSDFQADFERHTVLIFRWTTLATLFFVSFHKLNEDFFDPAVSCEKAIKAFSGRNWSFEWLPAMMSFSSPLTVVLFEGPTCMFLLMTFRRFGLIVTTLLFATIAFCDALTITLCVIVSALAFLTDEDKNIIRRHAKLFITIWFVLLALWLPMSSANYLSVRPWFQPALYQAVVIAVIVCVGGAQIITWLTPQIDWERRRTLRRLGFEVASLVPTSKTGRWVVGFVVLVWLINGFSPYLGLKFNYSFAMLSNLRVDDARWNHLLVPRWMRLTKHDGFFHVHKATVRYGSKDEAQRKGAVTLKPGLFSPQAFHDEMRRLRSLSGSVELALLLECQGTSYDYQGKVSDLSFLTFLDKLPKPHGHWLHNFLPADGPMGCKH